MFEPSDLFLGKYEHAATSLVYVRETLEDERHEQAHEDIHAQDVPGDEQRAGPCCATAITVEKISFDIDAIWRRYCREILHDLVPSFATTHTEQENQGFWNVSEILVASLVFSEARQAKGLR